MAKSASMDTSVPRLPQDARAAAPLTPLPTRTRSRSVSPDLLSWDGRMDGGASGHAHALWSPGESPSKTSYDQAIQPSTSVGAVRRSSTPDSDRIPAIPSPTPDDVSGATMFRRMQAPSPVDSGGYSPTGVAHLSADAIAAAHALHGAPGMAPAAPDVVIPLADLGALHNPQLTASEMMGVIAHHLDVITGRPLPRARMSFDDKIRLVWHDLLVPVVSMAFVLQSEISTIPHETLGHLLVGWLLTGSPAHESWLAYGTGPDGTWNSTLVQGRWYVDVIEEWGKRPGVGKILYIPDTFGDSASGGASWLQGLSMGQYTPLAAALDPDAIAVVNYLKKLAEDWDESVSADTRESMMFNYQHALTSSHTLSGTVAAAGSLANLAINGVVMAAAVAAWQRGHRALAVFLGVTAVAEHLRETHYIFSAVDHGFDTSEGLHDWRRVGFHLAAQTGQDAATLIRFIGTGYLMTLPLVAVATHFSAHASAHHGISDRQILHALIQMAQGDDAHAAALQELIAEYKPAELQAISDLERRAHDMTLGDDERQAALDELTQKMRQMLANLRPKISPELWEAAKARVMQQRDIHYESRVARRAEFAGMMAASAVPLLNAMAFNGDVPAAVPHVALAAGIAAQGVATVRHIVEAVEHPHPNDPTAAFWLNQAALLCDVAATGCWTAAFVEQVRGSSTPTTGGQLLLGMPTYAAGMAASFAGDMFRWARNYVRSSQRPA